MATKNGKSGETERQRILREFAERLNEALDDMDAPQRGKIPGRQPWLAEKVGKSQRGVGKWITGEGMPMQEDQLPLADFLGVRVEWLIFGLGPKHENKLRARIIRVINSTTMELSVRQKKNLIDRLVACVIEPENAD